MGRREEEQASIIKGKVYMKILDMASLITVQL